MEVLTDKKNTNESPEKVLKVMKIPVSEETKDFSKQDDKENVNAIDLCENSDDEDLEKFYKTQNGANVDVEVRYSSVFKHNMIYIQ